MPTHLQCSPSVLRFLEFSPSQVSIASVVIVNIDDPTSPPRQKAFVHVLIYLSHFYFGWVFSYYSFCLLLCLCSPSCSLLCKADLCGLCQGSPLCADFQLGLANGKHRQEIGGGEGSKERVYIPLAPFLLRLPQAGCAFHPRLQLLSR